MAHKGQILLKRKLTLFDMDRRKDPTHLAQHLGPVWRPSYFGPSHCCALSQPVDTHPAVNRGRLEYPSLQISCSFGGRSMNLKRSISTLLFAALLAGPFALTSAATPTKHTASNRSHKANSRPKTVHVRSYKKKDGTVVKAHDRAAPQP
jgi:hypothetical protein